MSYGTHDPARCVPAGERTPKCQPPGARREPQRPLFQRGRLWARGNINKAVTRARRRPENHHGKRPGPWLARPGLRGR